MGADASRVQLVAGLLRRDNRLLLCHRQPDRRRWPNVWDLPGGQVGDGESTPTALVRELFEELGVHVDPPRGSPWRTLSEDEIVLHMYLIDHWTGEVHNAAPEEHDMIRWVSDEELADLELADPSYRQVLRDAF